ncbi:MAG: Rieske 2Fe-2S domain-containing protein [Deltaproteobacteria bacterium]|nr:Rieske 2Fe-2S domain-containing protein [Deltaproteobacteria bacterium]
MSGSEDRRTNRRGFLKTSAQVTGVVALAGVCQGCALFNKNDIGYEADPKADKVTLPLAKFPQLEAADGFVNVVAKDGDVRLVVLRKPDGGLVALSMECTHMGCDVDWEKKDQQFVCPCHGSRFSADGAVTEGPADEPLKQYSVSEADGTVVVAL